MRSWPSAIRTGSGPTRPRSGTAVRAFYSVKELLAGGSRFDAASVCSAGKENGGDHYEPTIELLSRRHPGAG